jgi:ankyrin repeat protein
VDEHKLMAAVDSGDADAVAAELEAGADVNALSPSGFTPLMVASQNGDAAIVRLLLDAGASARIVDPLMKATPGHKAGYRGHADVARVLVDGSDLDVDAQGPYNGYTALHDAVWHGHAKAAQAFVEGGARLDLEGLDGRTPLDMAVEYGYDDIAAMLRSADAFRGDGSG